MGKNTAEHRKTISPEHCEIPGCRWPYRIQRHRMTPGREGGKYVKGNVIELAPNAHWLADNGYIFRSILRRIVMSRPKDDNNVVDYPCNEEGSETHGRVPTENVGNVEVQESEMDRGAAREDYDHSCCPCQAIARETTLKDQNRRYDELLELDRRNSREQG